MTMHYGTHSHANFMQTSLTGVTNQHFESFTIFRKFEIHTSTDDILVCAAQRVEAAHLKW